MHPAPLSRPRARKGDGDLLRNDLIRVAGELLAEAGEPGVTVRAVAARAGVSTPSVYLHFADKVALLDAVALEAWQTLGQRMDEAAAGSSDPFESLRRRGEAYVACGLEHPDAYRLLMMRAPLDGEQAGPRLAATEACAHLLEAVEQCIEAGVFRAGTADAMTLTLSLWAAVHGCVALLIAHPEFPWPKDLSTFVTSTIRMAGMGTAVMSRVTSPPRARSRRLAPVLDKLAAHLNKE